MRSNTVKFFLTLIFGLNCVLSVDAQNTPIDGSATVETVNLYRNLLNLPKNKIMFGHQDDISAGVGWKNLRNRSDIRELVGDYPAVYGFDLGYLELGKETNVSKVSFAMIKEYVSEVYQRGGIITFSWHANNPVNPAMWVKSKRVKRTVGTIFSDPNVLKTYNEWLNRLANYFNELKDDSGRPIPVLFRPFHENTGSWFWWGRNSCTPEEYVKLWRYTVDYFKAHNVHNLLYVYSTGTFKSESDFLERYPGDNYADLLGVDIYQQESKTGIEDDASSAISSSNFKKRALPMITMLKNIGVNKNKPYALTEVGFKAVPSRNWWTQTLLPLVKNSGLSYIFLWGNYSATSFWGVYKGQVSADDFKRFYQDQDVIFQNTVSKLKLYQKKQ
ncbi:glycoside hydrolase family 26 protein [Mucilaginibacter litoreus]|uniref:Glycoside hydrolase family 26 protein n=1 Tax=Mucilaginibacter litoreus TaxID=1048221 RepID=A0ABW3AXB0_9SPHI